MYFYSWFWCYLVHFIHMYSFCPPPEAMAFKRSAVRSRLSPPEKFQNLRILELFLCFTLKKFEFSSGGCRGASTWPELKKSLFWPTKSLRKSLCRIQAHRRLDVKVVLGHICIHMPHKTLYCGIIHAQRLKLAHIGMAAAMECQHPYSLNRRQGHLKLIPKIGRIAALSIASSWHVTSFPQ